MVVAVPRRYAAVGRAERPDLRSTRTPPDTGEM
jgi:hypothetical protein